MDESNGTPSQVALCRLILEREMKNMPNIKSAKKRVKVIETKTLQNKMHRSALKTEMKKYDAALASGDMAAAQAAYKEAVKKVDQAAAYGIIHKNAAAHKKSQFTKKLNALNK
jgi:small subunit ribosomal protein S20